MRPERLIYTFVSFASYIDTSWGHGTPVEGVDRTAELAHGHGIPVTWNVNSGSIRVLGDRIRKWHEQYGDDVILNVEPPYLKANTKADLIQVIGREWGILKEAFPWVETKVGAAGIIGNELIQALEELDFKGLWGYCWEQTWWDTITHKGIPWGFWYINGSNYKSPHPGKGNITACEWTARDLNLSYHTGNPCIYSTDPNDVLRAGLCTGENIDYWKKLFDDYMHNTENNEYVYFTQQQESHEMEFTDAFAVYPFSHVIECEKMLDKFFNYIKGYGITITTLPKAIKHYQERSQYSVPCYMLTQDSPIRPEINEYTMTLGGAALGPWPETFLYYDSQCQLAFVKAECKPRMFRNYRGNSKSDEEFDEAVPLVTVEKFEKSDDRIKVEFSVDSGKPIPFGLTYWDDLSGFSIEECTDVMEAKMIEDKLVFMRFNLLEEKKTIKLTLSRL